MCSSESLVINLTRERRGESHPVAIQSHSTAVSFIFYQQYYSSNCSQSDALQPHYRTTFLFLLSSLLFISCFQSTSSIDFYFQAQPHFAFEQLLHDYVMPHAYSKKARLPFGESGERAASFCTNPYVIELLGRFADSLHDIFHHANHRANRRSAMSKGDMTEAVRLFWGSFEFLLFLLSLFTSFKFQLLTVEHLSLSLSLSFFVYK